VDLIFASTVNYWTAVVGWYVFPSLFADCLGGNPDFDVAFAFGVYVGLDRSSLRGIFDYGLRRRSTLSFPSLFPTFKKILRTYPSLIGVLNSIVRGCTSPSLTSLCISFF
jgi:hypothetical protein